MRTITLAHPLSDGKDKIETLSLRDGDAVIATDFMYQDIDGTEARAQALIAALSGLPEASIRKLRGPDYFAAKNAAFEIIGTLILDNEALPVEPSQTLALVVPIPVGASGRMISTLKFRGHTLAEDYLGLDVDGGVNRSIRMIASFTGTDLSIISRLSGADFLAADKKTEAIINADRGFDQPEYDDNSEDNDPKKPNLGSDGQS